MIPSLDINKYDNRKSFIKLLKVYDMNDSNFFWDYVFAEVLYFTENKNREVIEVHLCRLNAKPAKKTVFKGYAYYNPQGVIHKVSITNDSLIINDTSYRGKRLGSWAMNQIVKWAKYWPQADLNIIKLSEVDADNKERRNKFYENFGINFNYNYPLKESGRSYPMKCLSLKTHEHWNIMQGGNIEELFLDVFIEKNFSEMKLLRKRNRDLKQQILKLRTTFFKKAIRSLKKKLTKKY